MSLSVDQRSKNDWQTVKIHRQKYSVRAEEKNGSWQIFLTDLVDIWTETITPSQILQRCEQLNPSLSIEDIDLSQIIDELFSNISENAARISVQSIDLVSQLEGGVFKFSIHLKKGDSALLWEQVTRPLCLVAGDLNRKQAILLNLVEKKDEEIREYVLNGAKLVRQYIKTERFNKDLLEKQASKDDVDSSINAFQAVMKLRGNLEPDVPSIKNEPIEIRSAENTVKIETECESAAQTETTAEHNNESKIVSPKTKKVDSNKIARKSITIGHDDNSSLVKRTLSAQFSPSKRSKTSINDFIR